MLQRRATVPGHVARMERERASSQMEISLEAIYLRKELQRGPVNPTWIFRGICLSAV